MTKTIIKKSINGYDLYKGYEIQKIPTEDVAITVKRYKAIQYRYIVKQKVFKAHKEARNYIDSLVQSGKVGNVSELLFIPMDGSDKWLHS